MFGVSAMAAQTALVQVSVRRAPTTAGRGYSTQSEQPVSKHLVVEITIESPDRAGLLTPARRAAQGGRGQGLINIVPGQAYAWRLMRICAPSLPVRPTCGGRC